MDGTEAEACSDSPSVEEVSVSESVGKVDATCPHVPEACAGAPGCPVDQVGQCQKQPPMTRDPFSEAQQNVPEDDIGLYLDDQDTDLAPVVRSFLNGWLN